MAEPIIRETVVDELLLEKAEKIVNNFPDVTGDFDYDIQKYRENNKILNELLYQRNLPNDSEGINKKEHMREDGTFLIVKMNPRVEDLLDRFISLQSDYLDKIIGK